MSDTGNRVVTMGMGQGTPGLKPGKEAAGEAG